MHRKLNVRLLVWTVVVLVPVGIAIHFFHGFQVRRHAATLLDRGDQEMTAGQADKALAHYAQYLGFVPDDADAREKYVRLLDQVADPSERMRVVLLMERLLLERPDRHDLRFRLVHNLITIGRVADAAQQINILAGRWGDPAELKHMLGWCQDAREQYTAAAASFREAIRLDAKRLSSYALLAEVIGERLGDADEARRVLDAMVEANPKAYEAYLVRARALLRRGDEDGADRDLKAALDLAPEEPAVALAAAERLQARGKSSEAYTLLEAGVRHDPRAPALYKAMADLKIRAGDRAAAVAVLAQGLEKLPQAVDLLALQTDLRIDQGELDRAGRQLKELRKLVPASALPDYLQARIAISKGQWPNAIPLLERCRKEMGPQSGWASRIHALLGVCYRQAGDPVQELAAFRRAVLAEPGWAAVRAGLGSALLDSGRIEDAVTELQLARAGTDVPKELWVVLGRALLYRNQGMPEAQRDWSEIEVALAKAQAAQPHAQEVAVLRAEVLAARKDLPAARAALESARDRARMAKAPGLPLLWCALAELAERQGQPAVADRTLAEAEAELGDVAEIRMARCRLWGGRGDGAARKGLTTLADDLGRLPAPARTRLRRALAETWARLGDPTRARALWQQVADDLPQDVTSRFALLDLALLANQPDRARRLLTELRKREGSQGMLWRYGTAALRVLEGRTDPGRLPEARKQLTILERQQPDWGRVPLLQARADELEGRFDNAARHYERAVELGELQPAVVARLVELLLQRQETLRAEEALSRFQQRRPLTPTLLRLAAEVAAGNHNAAVAAARARQAVRLPSNDYRDYLWLARIHQAIDAPAEAEECLREAVRLADHAPDAWVALIEHLGWTGKADEAALALAQARQKLPAERRPLTLARADEALHQLTEAEAEYGQALAATPNDFIALAQAAEFFTRQDRADRAEPLLRRLLSPAVAAPAVYAARARRALAVLLANGGASAEALELLSAAKADDDSTAAERVRLYIVGQDPAQLARALTQLQDSLTRQPAAPAERLLLADLLLAAGKPAQACAALQPLATRPAPVPQHVARYVRALLRAGNVDEAAAALAPLERWEPQASRTRALQEALRLARAEKK